jgi:hypothetical protein
VAPAAPSPSRPGRGELVLLAAATLLAAWLRMDGLREQVLGGDELHAVRVMVEEPYAAIPGLVLPLADYPVPLVLLGKLLSEALPLDEWLLRLPVLLCGIALPAALYLGSRRWLTPAGAALLAAVAAAHPLLVFYGRFLRPYGPCLLLAFGALVALQDWHATRRRGRLALAVACGALACWLHVLSGLVVGLLFLGACVRELRARAGAPRGALLATAACGALALLLNAPALPGLHAKFLGDGDMRGVLTTAALVRNASVLSGWPSPWPIAALLPLSALGARALARRGDGSLWLLAVPALGVPLLTLLVKPSLIEFSTGLARYALALLPLLLLLAVAGLQSLAGGAGRWLLPGVALALATTWALAGPWSRLTGTPHAFAHHNVFQTLDFVHDPHWNGQPLPVPEVYRWPGLRGPLLEAPAPEGFADNPLPWWQHVHGLPVRVLVEADSFRASPRLALRNVAVLRGAATDFGGARFVVLHRDVPRELAERLRLPVTRRAQGVHGPAVVARLEAGLRAACGAPVFVDRDALLFEVPGGR